MTTEQLKVVDSLDQRIFPDQISFSYSDKLKCFQLKVTCNVKILSISINEIEDLKDRIEGLILDNEQELLGGLND